jgi:hypothetical protein
MKARLLVLICCILLAGCSEPVGNEPPADGPTEPETATESPESTISPGHSSTSTTATATDVGESSENPFEPPTGQTTETSTPDDDSQPASNPPGVENQ